MQRVGQRLVVGAGAARAPFSSAREAVRILVIGDRASKHQRERDEPDRRHVRAVIETCGTDRDRDRDPQLVPQALAVVLQLFDRRPHHVLDDDDPRAGGDDQALGRDQAMRDVTRVLVQQRDRRHELPEQAQRGVQIELQTALRGDAQHVRQPDSFDVVRDDREPGRVAVDAPDPRVVRVPEIREPRRALAQGELEGGHGQQLRTHPQDLQQIAGRGVDRDDAVAEAVGEERRFGLIGGRGHGCHKQISDGSRVPVQPPDHGVADRQTAATRTARASSRVSTEIVGRTRLYNDVARFAFL